MSEDTQATAAESRWWNAFVESVLWIAVGAGAIYGMSSDQWFGVVVMFVLWRILRTVEKPRS
jgi:hypothetical protein